MLDREALDSGTTTSLALLETALARIDEPGGEGARAFTKVHRERARAMAGASDLYRAAGVRRSAFEGLPISIKDLFDVAGEITLAGSVALDNAAPARANAEVVDRLICAGAVIVGRTNMTEFAFSGLGINPHYPAPLNPYDRAGAHIPGGSSSGAAVSVSDGMAVAAIGSDTGGSVRIPAALCGLVGFKPTARRVPRRGVLPLSTTLDSVGPIARNVADCAELDAILSGDPRGPIAATPLAGRRFAAPSTIVLDRMDTSVAHAYAESLSALSRAGAVIAEIPIPEFAALASINAKGTITAAEAHHWHRGLLERSGARYDPFVRARIEAGAALSAADYQDLLQARDAWIAAVEQRLAGFDAMLMPTVPIVAPKFADLLADPAAYVATNLLLLRNPSLVNFLDGCAASIPCHELGAAPVGLSLAACRGDDAKLLSITIAAEAVMRERGALLHSYELTPQ
jgi:aspartyl-tRNA(Asn)/glutamyl-tRNA(Gln) amidotransferase subunit A